MKNRKIKRFLIASLPIIIGVCILGGCGTEIVKEPSDLVVSVATEQNPTAGIVNHIYECVQDAPENIKPDVCVAKKKNKASKAKKENKPKVSDEEYKLLMRVCMSECGGKWGEPMDGKVAVVTTVLNRADAGMGSIKEVILAPHQYSTADNGEPDETVREAVDYALSHRNEYPKNMIYFRTDYYHDFGTPYKKIGSHYFSLGGLEH